MFVFLPFIGLIRSGSELCSPDRAITRFGRKTLVNIEPPTLTNTDSEGSWDAAP